MSTLENIRKHVFRATQSEFAAIARVTQATVSRWENGGAPTLIELIAIREQALKRPDIEWQDSFFFEMSAIPTTEVAQEAAE